MKAAFSRRRWLVAAAALVIGIFTLSVGAAPKIAVALDVAGALPDSAEFIMVLGNRPDDGTLSVQAVERLRRALVLVESHYRGASVLVSGGESTPGVIESRLMRAFLVDAGFPADRILMESESLDTLENLRNSSRLIPSDAQVVVVTHGYHTYRVKDLAERMGFRVAVASTAPDTVTNPVDLPSRLQGAFWVYRELGAIVFFKSSRDSSAGLPEASD